jgi:dissimilatory sulfite reductase (desulfoviridin) alpha/beta subunit
VVVQGYRGEGPDPMLDAVDGSCPKCAHSDDVTSIEWASRDNRKILASRCWSCGHLWSVRDESSADIAEANQYVLTR